MELQGKFGPGIRGIRVRIPSSCTGHVISTIIGRGKRDFERFPHIFQADSVGSIPITRSKKKRDPM